MRLDKYLVENNICENRSKAINLIREQLVFVNGSPAKKAGQKITDTDQVKVLEHQDFVSRSARKLWQALEEWGIGDLQGVGLDLGASTGGFTQVLLQKGLQKVYALDVGDSQLHPKLQEDSRVIDLSPINARDPFQVAEKVDVVTMDISFISSTKIFPNLISHLKPEHQIFTLFKPQFEGVREDILPSGVVKPNSYDRIFNNYLKWLKDNHFEVIQQIDSKVVGKKGNKEKVLQVRYLFQD